MSNSVIFEYQVFDEVQWKKNVDHFFFLFMLGLLYVFVLTWYKDFEVSPITLIGAICSGWIIVLTLICYIEAFVATIVKIALNPGCLLTSKFTVLKVFPKSVGEVYLRYFAEFKPVTSTRTIIVNPPTLYTDAISSNSIVLNGFDLSGISNTINISGYLKEPDNFK